MCSRAEALAPEQARLRQDLQVVFHHVKGHSGAKLGLLEHARKKTTQKVNLFEKVQIPGFQEAVRKIKRFMEDEENLSKSSQKILKALQEKRKEDVA